VTATKDLIDLRSDTVTRPTLEMRKAMVDAPVGDDLLGDDPTVIKLQEKVAKILGKDSSLFVPSGTMANQIAIRCHTEAGDEIMMEATSHPFLYEAGALGGICGVQTQLLSGERGLLKPEHIENAIRPKHAYAPPSKLVILENTHNQGGGTIYPLSLIQEIRKVCQSHEISMHLDGARLWNACVATGHAPAEYAQYFESVSVCLSKGLGAPVGSLIAGSQKLIERALRFRKMFGGAMRQSGILAAAGIYAMDHHFERLREDHENAKYFANELAKISNIVVDVNEVETNIVYFGTRDRSPKWVEQELKNKGVLVFAIRKNQVRAITHLDVNRSQINQALQIISELV